VENRERLYLPPPRPLHRLPRTLTQTGFLPPPPHAFTAAWATPLSCSFYFHACCLSFLVWLASHLAISLGNVIPRGSQRTHPRPYNMSTAGVRKGRNWHHQAETILSGLTLGLATPFLKGTGPESECRFTLRARILRTQVSTSTSTNSAKKGWSGQLGPGYLHIVASRR
jgi:hypothetical protein